jgi:L-ascorbate metabolism protein UlaG (beta-lactamase superfamily)
VTPPAGSLRRLEVAGIAVEVLNLPHNRTPKAEPENIGFLIHLGGATVLHVGDADPNDRVYLAYRLPERRIDVAILPFWYATGAAALVRSAIAPRHLILTHVSPNEAAAVAADVKRKVPDAVTFTVAGQRWGLPEAGNRE